MPTSGDRFYAYLLTSLVKHVASACEREREREGGGGEEKRERGEGERERNRHTAAVQTGREREIDRQTNRPTETEKDGYAHE